MISVFSSWIQDRKLALGLFLLFIFACYDLWIHPLLFGGNEMSLCIMKEFWGIPCPACGTAHGVQHLANGDVKSALASNPFSLFVVFLFPLFISLSLNDLYYGRNKLGKFLKSIDHFFKKKPVYFWLGIVLVLTNWIWNILKNQPAI